jgi:murein DD-endopeptidase MepM/ murein hydrolase activator NlpD
LLRDFFTIVVIPRRTERVRKIRIPIILLVLVAVVLVGFLVVWGYMLVDYIAARNRMASFEMLQIHEARQREEIQELYSRIESIDLHFENLEAFNQKLRQMTRQGADRRTGESAPERSDWADKLSQAQREGILSVIAADSADIDSKLRIEQEVRFDNLMKFMAEQQNPMNRIPDRLPVKGYQINQYGPGFDSYLGETRPQDGISIITRNFQPVYAPADGLVVSLIQGEDYGNTVVIDHNNGFVTRYGHLAHFDVAEGDVVRRGDMIAQAGNTGHTTGTRLSYQVIYNGVPLNPNRFTRENLYDQNLWE